MTWLFHCRDSDLLFLKLTSLVSPGEKKFENVRDEHDADPFVSFFEKGNECLHIFQRANDGTASLI